MTHFVRISGNDSYSGLTRTTAWATIAHALVTISDGDTLIIGPGDFTTENLNLTGLTNIRVIGDPGYRTGDTGYTRVAYCTMDNGCYVENIDIATLLILGSNTHVSRCRVSDSMWIWGNEIGPHIKSCHIETTVVDTINIRDFRDVILEAVSILGSFDFPSLSIQNSEKISLQSSIIVAKGDQYLIYGSIPDTGMNFNHNLYFGSSGKFFYNCDTSTTLSEIVDWYATGQDSDSLQADPILVGATPASGSPAIGRGINIGAPIDVYGVLRYPGVYDLGAVQSIAPPQLPREISLRRYRFESPLTSAAWIDNLSEVQRALVHYFGYGRDIGGALGDQLSVMTSSILSASINLEDIQKKVDNVVSALHMLMWRAW